ncbi:MAG: GNAT family N-acetyltransferase [Caldiserica bacterium]|nr:GNAT family N-acetyltransferase [Caldisericota bacterium]
MPNFELIEINSENIASYPQVICFINPKDPTFKLKVEWLEQRFAEGLKITALKVEGEKKIAGFIEYVPGEFVWRAVECKDYMFIHCLWVGSKSDRSQGFGSALVNHVIEQARNQGMKGVCVLTSNDAFMAKDALFEKLGFVATDQTKVYKLQTFKFDKDEGKPKIINNSKILAGMKGWHILYSKQCPWVARLVAEVKPVLDKNGIEAEIKEIKTAKQAQAAPSIYGVINLIHDGKLLSERYISATRLQNIISKETSKK